MDTYFRGAGLDKSKLACGLGLPMLAKDVMYSDQCFFDSYIDDQYYNRYSLSQNIEYGLTPR